MVQTLYLQSDLVCGSYHFLPLSFFVVPKHIPKSTPSTEGTSRFHSEMNSSSLMSTCFLLASGYLSWGNIESSDAVNGNVNGENGGVTGVGLSEGIYCVVERRV